MESPHPHLRAFQFKGCCLGTRGFSEGEKGFFEGEREFSKNVFLVDFLSRLPSKIFKTTMTNVYYLIRGYAKGYTKEQRKQVK